MLRLMAAMVSLCLVACGGTIKVKGSTQHTVSGDVHTVSEVVLKIDVSGCSSLTGQDQAACITKTVDSLGDLVAMIKAQACKDDDCKNSEEK